MQVGGVNGLGMGTCTLATLQAHFETSPAMHMALCLPMERSAAGEQAKQRTHRHTSGGLHQLPPLLLRAGRIFARLAARVSEGEVGFGEVAGGQVLSVRQQAVRGLAQVRLGQLLVGR